MIFKLNGDGLFPKPINSFLVSFQSLALPTLDEKFSVPVVQRKAVRSPRSPIVDQFRIDINYWFVRFQNFYDRSNAAMRTYRLAHVDLITSMYNRMNNVIGDNLESISSLSRDLTEIIQRRRTELGEADTCISDVVASHGDNVARISTAVQTCAIYANQTMENLLRNTFYLEFATIQNTISTTPNAVIDVLSRGNVLQDEQAIIEFLRARYEVIDLQWLGAVSQLLRWESNRFTVESLFLVDQVTICLAEQVLAFIHANSEDETRALAC